METRELRYFVAVAEALHFGRAAEQLGIAQPPLSRAIQQLERRLGVTLLTRDRRGVTLTAAGEVLLAEAHATLEAVTAAAARTRRAGAGPDRLVLATKAGAHELLRKILDAYAAEPGAVEVEVLMGGVGGQDQLLREGRADVALLQPPYNSLAGLDAEQLTTEGQIAVLPAEHPLAARSSLTMADISDVPGLPMAQCPGTSSPGTGLEVRDLAHLSQLIALGRALAVKPESARAWLWGGHAAVPLLDAPPVATYLAWPAHSRSRTVADFVRAATRI
ncbi:LysR family transcriptional regulator [Actinoplanes sp. N902-109]|uniref:LysR family transcriptional regulator n=1 Tax=Actinoplanes sp. (strain N902-109) TaxID=649831 RepID=UPI0018DE01CA|nr:LysR family transcriptional regulator [Actinoplanes sp. N902-109]